MWHILDSAGVVQAIYQCSEQEAIANTPPGHTAVILEGQTADWFEGSTPRTKPTQPTPHHEWDWTTKQWVPDIASSIAARKAIVDSERSRRSVLPITYNAAPFDADTLARERISGTLARLLRGDGLPQGWLGWRDADNQMHWANDTAETVQSHLAGLSVAIEDREQALLIAAWTHKHNISQLTTVEAVLAYDTAAGWP